MTLKTRALTASALVISAVLIAALHVGCETSPADENYIYITVTPKFVDVPEGQSQMFVASGATRYEWSIPMSATNDINNTNRIWGILDRNNGDTVMYTNLRTPTSTVNRIQVLSITGYIGSQGTNAGSGILTASTEAYITHVP